jgi:hypothetical protein
MGSIPLSLCFHFCHFRPKNSIFSLFFSAFDQKNRFLYFVELIILSPRTWGQFLLVCLFTFSTFFTFGCTKSSFSQATFLCLKGVSAWVGTCPILSEVQLGRFKVVFIDRKPLDEGGQKVVLKVRFASYFPLFLKMVPPPVVTSPILIRGLLGEVQGCF